MARPSCTQLLVLVLLALCCAAAAEDRLTRTAPRGHRKLLVRPITDTAAEKVKTITLDLESQYLDFNNLSNAQYEVIPVKTGGAGTKLKNFTNGLFRARNQLTLNNASNYLSRSYLNLLNPTQFYDSVSTKFSSYSKLTARTRD